jgi:hypothetical protein
VLRTKASRCETAFFNKLLEVGVPATPYRFVRHWLERRPALTLRQVAPIIRQLTLYRDLVDNKAQEHDPT